MSSSPLADSRAPTIRPIPLLPPASSLWRRARRACCGGETPRSITRRGRACRRRRRAPRPISRRFCANSTRGFSPRPTTTRPSTATCARPRKPPARKSKIPTTKNCLRRGWPRLRAPIIRRAASRAASPVFAEAIGARLFLSAASRKTIRLSRALFSISSKRAARLCLSPARRARRANRFCANCGEKNSIRPLRLRPRPHIGAAAIGVSRAPNRWSARPKPRSPRSKRCRRTRASRRSRSIARWRGGFAPAPRRAESFCATPPVGAPRLSSSARRFCASPPRPSPSTRAPISKR